MRCERVGATGRLGRAGHQDRAQEHELVPVHRARDQAEIERQIALLDAGEPVVQETLHFDPASGQRLTPLRSKEEAHDYRYFPEPDLVPVLVTEPRC